MARQIADKELPKSRRQQKLEKALPRKEEPLPPREENALKRKRDEALQDPKLKEFLEGYQAPAKTNLWTNGEPNVDAAAAATADTVPAAAVVGDESDDEYQVIAKKPKTALDTANSPTDDQGMHGSRNDGATQTEVHNTSTGEVAADSQQEPVAEQGPVSDADWLRSRTKRALDLVEEEDTPVEAPPPARISPPAQIEEPVPVKADNSADAVEPSEEEEEKIRQTGRLYLRNLHYEITEEDLRIHFSKYESIEEVGSLFPSPLFHSMMNVKIGTTDAPAYEVAL